MSLRDVASIIFLTFLLKQIPCTMAGQEEDILIDVHADRNKTTVKILSIDGGGIRGLIPAVVLAEIEKELNTFLPKKVCLADSFDIIAGTSTGGLIALGLALPDNTNNNNNTQERKKSLSDIVELYYKKGATIFPPESKWLRHITGLHKPKFDVTPLERELQAFFGHTNFSEAISHILIPAYELRGNDMHVFDSKIASLKKTQENIILQGSYLLKIFLIRWPGQNLSKRGNVEISKVKSRQNHRLLSFSLS